MDFKKYLTREGGRDFNGANEIARYLDENPLRSIKESKVFIDTTVDLLNKEKSIFKFDKILNRAYDVYGGRKTGSGSDEFVNNPKIQKSLSVASIRFYKIINDCIKKRIKLRKDYIETEKEYVKIHGKLPYPVKEKMHDAFNQKLEKEILQKIHWRIGMPNLVFKDTINFIKGGNKRIALKVREMFKELTNALSSDFI